MKIYIRKNYNLNDPETAVQFFSDTADNTILTDTSITSACIGISSGTKKPTMVFLGGEKKMEVKISDKTFMWYN